MSKGIHCHFIAVSAAPEVEFSNRHQATRSTAWLFCGLTGQRSMQSPCYSSTVLSHSKPGMHCGSSPTPKEDTHPASNPQQGCSGSASGMFAGKTLHSFICSPRSSPSLANGHWIVQAWLSGPMFWTQADSGSNGTPQWLYPCHSPTGPSSLHFQLYFSCHTFRGGGEDWAVIIKFTFTIRQTEQASKLSQCLSCSVYKIQLLAALVCIMLYFQM